MVLGLYNQNRLLIPFQNKRRLQHTLFIGKPRTGKTTTLTRLALDDIHEGKPVVFLGSTILEHIPEERQEDAINFYPDREYPFSFNLLSDVDEDKRALFTATFLDTVVAFTTSVKDAKVLEPEFHIENTQKTHLYDLKPFEAKVAIDGKDTNLKMPEHAYPLTPRVKKKIIARSRSQYCRKLVGG